VNGDSSASLTNQPTLTSSATSSSHVSGSPYSINPSGAVDGDYSISYVGGTLTVTPVALTITADGQTMVYGAALPTLTASYSGLVNGDTAASLTTQPVLTTAATSSSHVSGNPYSITASGAADSDYSISYVSGALTVTPAALTITANNQSKVYGAAAPALTASFSGFVNSDTSASLTTQPTLTTTATSSSHVSGNPYSITASGAADSDYSISYVSGTLTVTPAALTITAVNKTKTYGASVPTLTVSYSGFVNSDTTASLTTQPTLSTTGTSSSHVSGSPYTITASGAVDADYSISYVSGTLTVTPVALTITAVNKTKVYGAALPTLTANYSGFVNGDSSASLTTQPTLTTTATSSSHVSGSPYTITASGAVDADYNISYVTGTLSVTKAALSIIAANQTKVYGAALPTLTASYTGFVNGDTSASLTTQPTLTTTATASSHVSGSPYSITASGAADTDYSISYVSGTLTVTSTALTVTAVNQTKVYGAGLPTLTASYSGFVNGDTSASLTTQPTLTTTATASSHVSGSPYTITASAAVDSDYSMTYIAGSLSVTTAALTITAVNKAKVYGAALPALTASYSGFVNGDSSVSLTTQPTLTTTATASSHVSGNPYSIAVSGATDSDYAITYVAGSLTVTAAPLTVTANSQTKAYGAALPALTTSYSGFVNGDSSANLSTLPTLSTTATASSHVGTYTITASGAADTDYTISYVNGTLSVASAGLTITAVNQTKVYGAALPTLTASYSGFVNGDTSASLTTQPTLTTTATASSHVSGSPYTITASGAVDSDYAFTYVAGSLSVTAVPLTITANNQTKSYGAALPSLTASYSGFVNGDSSASLTTKPTLTTTATASSLVGTYAITASGAVDPNYTISYVGGTLTVATASLTITAVNQTKVYGAALPTLTASYSGFVNGDTSASLTTQPTLTTTASASSHVSGSPYLITASGAVDSEYSITYVTGTLIVTTAPLTITANNQTKPYGAALPALTASYGGFVNGDTSASLTTQPTLTTTASASSHVSGSPYLITASGAVDSDYSISYVAGTMSVTPVALTITANNQAKVYGAALPALTASFTGFVNGDTSASLTTQPTLSTPATASSHVSGNPYAITASGAVDSDYTISYAAGILTVAPAALTITAVNQTKVYGAALPTLTASYIGFVNGDSAASLTTQPTLSTTASVSSDVSGNPYAITASGAVDSDYTINYSPGILTITPAGLTITPNNQTKVYGAALPTLTASYSGFVAGDTAANLTTQPTLATMATVASHVGTYAITASGAVDPDYTITYASGTLSVTSAALTITAVNQTKAYGAVVPSLTASYSGFVNGDSSASLTTQPTLATTATVASHVSGNPYAITASGAVDSNYSITYVAGTLTITTAPLTITAVNKTKAYGAALPTLTASYSGFVNGDTSASLTTQPTLTTTATAGSHVSGSPYSITASGAVDTDYNISYVSGTMNVTAVALTITPVNQTKVYGAASPTLAASYTGFVNGDTAASLDTQPILSTTATASSGTGVYAITASGAADSDYTISYVGGTLTVTAAGLTITAVNQTKVYGAVLSTLTASYSGFVNGDTSASLTTQPTLTTTATASSHVSGNPYTISASGAADSNYTISYAAGILTVTPGGLTITANNQTMAYGSVLPALTASYNGFVNGDTSASLTTQPALTTTASASSHVSGNPYAITASGAVDSDYSISYVAGTLTVTPVALLITANNQTKVYGAALPALTASFTGFVNCDSAASLTTQPALSTSATASSDVSGNPYTIAASGAVDSDYTISYAAGILTVAPAALTITAVNQTKVYGAALPTLTASYIGFVNGDSAASLTTQPTLSTTASVSSDVSGNPYAITASGAVDSDYTINYSPGILTITPAGLTITPNNQTKVYGAALPTLTASYSGFVAGDTAANLSIQPTLTTTATVASHVGTYAITASGALDPDYTISYASGALSVTSAPLTIMADNQTKVYGAVLPSLTASYSGFVNGDSPASLTTQPTLATTATVSSHVAGNPYAITASGAVDTDYSISYLAGTLTITPAALTIMADNQTKPYGAAVAALTASYIGFVNGDSSSNLTTQPTLTTTATTGSPVAGNPYAITASDAADSDYTISYSPGILTVTPAALTLTVSADSLIKVYGAAMPTLTASYTGFVNGDTPESLDTQPTLSTTATLYSDTGTYPITVSGAVDTNYNISYVAGVLTVTAATLTVTADDLTRPEGEANPPLTYTLSGFVNGDTTGVVTGAPDLSTTAITTSPDGKYPITITVGNLSTANYVFNMVNGTLTVSDTPVTTIALTASPGSTSPYGQDLTFTAAVSAYDSGDPLPTGTVLFEVDGSPIGSAVTLVNGSATSDSLSNLDSGGHTIEAIYSGDSSYDPNTQAVTQTVTPAMLTITADSLTKVYGADLPVLTARYSGFVNGDTPASLTNQPTLSTTATISSDVSGNPYTITASGAVDSNYVISYATGILTITPAGLSITADNQTKVYGAALPTLTASYSGFVAGDTVANLSTQPTLTTTATANSHVGSYDISASGAVDSDYTISYAAGTLTVTSAELTISADNQSKVYGAALPTLTASYSGFVNGDSSDSLTTQPTLTTTATASSHVSGSPYAITAGGAADSDYSISYVGGSLTVTPTALTITASNQTKSYGAALPTLTATYTGFVNGDSSASLTTQPTLTTTATSASSVARNPYLITASGAVDSDYSISYVSGTLNVTAAALTITADNQIKVYGAGLQALTASYTGFVNGDTAASLDIQPTLSTTATATSHTGVYGITVSGAADSDYAISYTSGTLTVTAAGLTITADNQTKVYGAVLPTLTASYSGFVNGDTAASLETQPTLSTIATATSDTGTYAITASGAVDPDYTISYVSGILTVSPATLTVVADNLTRPEGDANPPLTYSLFGFVNGDTTDVVTGAPDLSTTATIASKDGQYPITVAVGTLDASNYDFTTVDGTLIVVETPVTTITLTASPGSTSTYGQAITFTANVIAFDSGDRIPTGTVLFEVDGSPIGSAVTLVNGSATSDSLSNLDSGGHTIEAIYSGDSSYDPNTQAVTQTVTPAMLTITADSLTKVYGADLPVLTARYSGFVNGDTPASLTNQPTLSTTATISSDVSGNPYTITASGAVDSNYVISYATGILTITPAGLSITADNQTKVYGAALPTLTASYSGFVAGDTVANLSTQPTLTTTATANSHVGSYDISASGAVDSDYTISYAAGTLTVTSAELTISADNQSKVYGAALPTLTASYSGFVNGDSSDSLTTQPTLTTTATASSHVSGSPYAITAGGAADSDYSISYVGGSLTVTPTALTITASNQTKSYGAALPTLTASYSGFVNGDSSASLTTQPTLTTTAISSSHVSGTPYAITASGAVDSDYSISYVSGMLTVTPVALTITVDNQTKVYGADLPTLTASYAGFVNGDTAASLDTLPSLSTTAAATSDTGTYPITAGGAVDTDYTIFYLGGTLTVSPADLMITAVNQTKVYGAALPTLAASYSGFVNGDSSASLTTQPTLTTTATASSHVSGNTYTITAIGAADSNYSISYAAGTLTVTPAALTIIADNQTKAYGAALPSLTASYNGFVNGDTSDNLTTQPTLTTTATTSSHVSGTPYSITASGAVDTDYIISYVSGMLTVTPVALAITADSQTKLYGAALPTLTASYSGFVNGDTSDSLTTQPTLMTTATTSSHVSGTPYAITASGAADSDYSISYVSGMLNVTPSALTITADNQTKVYGAALPTLTASYSGFVAGDTAANLSTQPALTTTAIASSHVGTYDISASSAVDSDYTISYAAGTLTVTSAELTISADNQSKVYGAALPTLTASYSGFVNGDSSDSLTTQPTLTTTATASSHVSGSPYAITAGGAADSDYSISYVGGALTVTPTALTITASNQTKAYGAALPTLTASYSGFVNGDTSASLTTQPTLTTTATTSSHVSGTPYAITASGAEDSDYSISYVSGMLNVTPVALTITADNLIKVYGADLPTLTASYAGFVNGDTAASLDTLPSLSTTAAATSDTGTYPITAGGAVDTDYTIFYLGGTLTVSPADLMITAVNQTKVYGAALPTLAASYSGFVNGDSSASLTTQPTLTTTATASSHVSGNTYTITAIGAADSNYSISYAAGTLTVTPAALTIIADNQTKAYGAALPSLTASYNGFVNGDTADNLTTQPTLTTTATTSSPVAGSPYSITASDAVDADYSITYDPGTVTVTPVGLTITAVNQTKAYGAALPTLSASYAGFVNGDTSANLTTQPTLTTTATASDHVSGNPYAITASGAVDSDYSISYATGILTITPAGLTITAVNQTKVYGAALPTLTASYAGFVNGDAPTSLTTQPTLSTTATAHSSTGVYAISASGAVDADYSITYLAGSLTVSAATLTITADNQTKVYGANLPTLTASYSGFVNGDTATSLDTLPTLSTTATASSDIGAYTITASNALDPDYTISYVGGTLTVSQATLTVIANDLTRPQGEANPPLTYSLSGLVNGDTTSVVNGTPILSTTATIVSPNGQYPIAIAVGTLSAANYDFITVGGTLTVADTPATTITITASPGSTSIYGQALTLTASVSPTVGGNPTPTGTVVFEIDGVPIGSSVTLVNGSATSESLSSPDVGRHTIQVIYSGDGFYATNTQAVTQTVTPAMLTITADNLTKTYGAALPILTASYTGFVNGDSATSLGTPPTLSTTATSHSHTGSYAITASGAVDSDYSITYVEGSLTVTAATLTITADNLTKAYGAALPSLTASYSGFVNGDTVTDLTTQPTLTTTASASSHVSGNPYTITASGAMDSDYSIIYVAGTLTVTPVALTITADNLAKAYGAALPTLTASYSGFVNGDTAASLTTLPVLTTAATASSHVKDSPFVITASGAVDSDYSISYVSGALSVSPVALTITADNQTKVYGAALPTLTASYTGFVNGDSAASLGTQPTLSTTATARSDIGAYVIAVSDAADSDYTISYVSGMLTVSPATITVTANNLTRPPGEANPPLTYTLSGLVNGDTTSVVSGAPILSTTATIVSPAGSYPITVAVGNLSAANYDFTTVGGTLTVANNPAITINPTTLPVATVGDSYSQQLTASGGSGSGYRFTSTGLPAGLSLTIQGLLSGTPTTAIGSPFAVDVTVTDGDGGTGSQTYTLTVKARAIAGTIVTSLARSYYGQEVTLTATFTATPAGSALMTGTVAFYDGNTYLGTEPFVATVTGAAALRATDIANADMSPTVSGTSNLSTSLLAVGNHILTAVYSGDANYPTATVETPVSVKVIAAVTSTTLTASTSPQGTTLIANVVVTSPGNPPVVGFISFYDGATLLGTEPVSNGVATLNVATLSPGMHSFKAVFSADGTFLASEASLVVSTDGPQVTHLLRYGFHWQPTYLLLYFNGPLDPTSAQNPANYQILGPSGHRITVVSAIYDSASHTVTLVPAERLNFHRRYCLTVNGVAPSGLTSPSGFLLDGAGNGHAGSNYVTTITWKNLAGRASKLPTLSLVHTAPPPPAKAQTLPHHTKVTLHSAAEARPRPAKVQMSPHHAKVTLHSAAVDHPLVTNSMHLRGAARR